VTVLAFVVPAPQVLSLKNCNTVTDPMLQGLKADRPSLLVVDYYGQSVDSDAASPDFGFSEHLLARDGQVYSY